VCPDPPPDPWAESKIISELRAQLVSQQKSAAGLTEELNHSQCDVEKLRAELRTTQDDLDNLVADTQVRLNELSEQHEAEVRHNNGIIECLQGEVRELRAAVSQPPPSAAMPVFGFPGGSIKAASEAGSRAADAIQRMYTTLRNLTTRGCRVPGFLPRHQLPH
jgi:small-conductance mechanosensitive channel